jgi:hypothetical protein
MRSSSGGMNPPDPNDRHVPRQGLHLQNVLHRAQLKVLGRRS